MDADADGRNIV